MTSEFVGSSTGAVLERPRFGYENVGPDFSIAGCTPGIPVGETTS